jgi:hypothetical protein
MKRNKIRLTMLVAIGTCLTVAIPSKIASAQTTPVATCNGSQSLGSKVVVQFKNVGTTPIRFGLLDYTCTFRAFPFPVPPNGILTSTNYPSTLYRVYEDVTNVLLNEYRLQESTPPGTAINIGRIPSTPPTSCNASESITPIAARFINTGVTPVEARWLDYTCNEVSYGNIAPGTTLNQSTFKTHLWRFYEVGTNALLSETRFENVSGFAFGRPAGQIPTCNASESVRAKTVKFTNLGEVPVQARWLNYDCTETPYSTIAPHTSMDQGTYQTHLWKFYEVGSTTPLKESRIDALTTEIVFGQIVPVQAVAATPPTITSTTTTEPATTTTTTTAQPLVFAPIENPPSTAAAPVAASTPAVTAAPTTSTTTTTTSTPTTTTTKAPIAAPPIDPPVSVQAPLVSNAAAKPSPVKLRRVCKYVRKNRTNVLTCSYVRT